MDKRLLVLLTALSTMLAYADDSATIAIDDDLEGPAVTAVEPVAPEAETPAADTSADAAPADEAPAPAADEPAADAAAEAAEAPSGEETPAADEATEGQDVPLATTTIGEEHIDEIDLEDDSALAARRPKVSGNLDDGLMSLVDIECDEASLGDIIRQFRKTTGANIICNDSTNLQKRISVSLKRVPWLQGMTAILSSRGFRIEERENIYRVVEDVQLIPVSTRTFALNHASAPELAKLFNETYGRKDAAGKITGPVATAFDGANVVVVTSTDKVIADCESIIKAVDKAVAQIYIEARFLELSSEAMHKLGMQWNSLESWGVSVKNLSGGFEYNNGRVGQYGSVETQRTSSKSNSDSKSTSSSAASTGSTSASASSSSSPSESLSSTIASIAPTALTAAPGAARTAENMAWHNARGFSGQLSADDFRLAMSAFEQLNDGKVFSNPKIIVSNGKEAKVDMTTKYPNVTIDSNFTGQNSQNLSVSTKLDTIPGEDKFMFAKEAFFSWGIMLTVKPRISPDGRISVEIVPTISDCTGYAEVSSNKDSDTPYTKYPIIEIKRLTTEFTMKDGCTAVIGGLSKTVEEDIDNGIPFLRKIPWIGPKLFGWKSRGKVQKEIIVCVTVGIANPQNLPSDLGLPTNAIIGREYVNGTRLEPGFRAGSAAEVLALDMSPIDERPTTEKAKRKASDEPKRGEVTITIVGSTDPNRQQPVKAAEPAPATEPAPAAEPAAEPKLAPAAEPEPAAEPAAEPEATETGLLNQLAGGEDTEGGAQ